MESTAPRSGLRFLSVVAGLALAAGGLTIARAAEPLTPEGAVALAVAQHPLLRAAGAEVAGARADTGVARSGWIPRIDLTEDVARSSNPVFAFGSKLGQQRFTMADFDIDALNSPDPITNAATRLTIRQNVWDGGMTTGGRRAAAFGLDAAIAGRERTRDAVALGALQAYWDAVLADAMLATAKDAEIAAGANAGAAGERVKEGLGVPSDRMQAEVRLAEVRTMRIQAQQGVTVARAALCVALGVPAGSEYELQPPEVTAAPEEPANAEAPAVARRADLRAIEARTEQARAAETIANAARLPQIGVQAQYELNGRSPFGNDGSNWTIGAAVRVPLFDGTETKYRLARARADRQHLEAMRDQATAGARLQLAAAEGDRNAATERLRTSGEAAGLAAEALRIVRERYDEGLAVMTELLGAEAALTQARSSQALSAHDLALARARVEFAAGTPLAPPEPKDKE
jgi:outer membrane protein